MAPLKNDISVVSAISHDVNVAVEYLSAVARSDAYLAAARCRRTSSSALGRDWCA